MRIGLILLVCSIVSFAVFAADPFIGFNSNITISQIDAELAKSNDKVTATSKAMYEVIKSELKDKSTVSTVAAFDATVSKFKKQYKANEMIKFKLIANRYKYLLQDPELEKFYSNNKYFKAMILGFMKLDKSKDEYKKILPDSIASAIDLNMVGTASYILDKYLLLTELDNGTEVINNLKFFYRKSLNKLDKKPEFKSFVVKVSLALKGYGITI